MNKWLYPILWSLIFGAYSFPQVTQAQFISLKKSRSNPDALLLKARTVYLESPSEAVDLVTEVILIGLQEDNPNIQGRGYQLLGEINESLEQYDLAASNYLKALQLFEQSGDLDQLPQLYKHLGDAYYQNQDLDNALRYYQKYLGEDEPTEERITTKKSLKSNFKEQKKISSSKEDASYDIKNGFANAIDPDEQAIRLRIAQIYNQKKDFRASKDNLTKAFDHADGYKWTFASSTGTNTGNGAGNELPVDNASLNSIAGDILLEQNDSDALGYYQNSLNSAQQQNDPLKISKAMDRIANYYSQSGRLQESKDIRLQNIRILDDAQLKGNLANEYLEVGFLDKKMENYRQAEDSFEKSIGLAEESEDIEIQAKGLQEVADLKVNRGLVQEALKYYQRYAVLKDSIYTRKENVLQQKLEVSNVLNQKQQRIEVLEKNDEINEKTIEILRQNGKTQQVLIYSLLGGILLIGGVGYLMYKNLRQRRIANQLIALRSLRSQMNPHFIFNALNSVNLYIAQKDERSANRYLTEFSKLMRSVLEQSQKDFIPLQQEIDMISLYVKLEHDRFKDKFAYTLDIDPQLDQENLVIPPMIVQPYVENAIWHGLRYKETLGELYVGYLKKEDHIHVLITDNGIGRKRSKALKTDNQKKTESTGMYNIEHRLQIINQMFQTNIELSVDDLNPEGGTKVEIRIPLNRD